MDQFLRVEKGFGKATLNGVEQEVEDGSSIVVPAGVKHNVVNSGTESMKLYTLYTPPHHKNGTVHKTKATTEGDDEHFDGKTSE